MLMFGRGFRAGIDHREQKKFAAKNEKKLRDEIRKKVGIEAAEMYDTFDMRVDRH
ncbi:putative RNA helicase [Helianthus annuus]|nr:putative RNA helicase [Helianthus annuus]